MKAGTVSNGEFWIRCPFCGDSQRNPHKAHFSVRLRDGAYHCHRCGQGGRLGTSQLLEITQRAGEAPVLVTDLERGEDEPLPDLIPGPASSRYSHLPRWHVNTEDGKHDAFELYDPVDRELIGILYRRADRKKKAQVVGERGIAWPSAPDALVSLQGKPLRIVEGPYDVLTPQDVAVFSLPSRSILEDLPGQFIILCPDGDVWTDPNLFFRFMQTVSWLMRPGRGWGLKPTLVGIEYLKDGKDPDEVPPTDRELLDRQDILQLLTEYDKRRV